MWTEKGIGRKEGGRLGESSFKVSLTSAWFSPQHTLTPPLRLTKWWVMGHLSRHHGCHVRLRINDIQESRPVWLICWWERCSLSASACICSEILYKLLQKTRHDVIDPIILSCSVLYNIRINVSNPKPIKACQSSYTILTLLSMIHAF